MLQLISRVLLSSSSRVLSFVCVCATTGMIQSSIDKDFIGNDAGGGEVADAVGR